MASWIRRATLTGFVLCVAAVALPQSRAATNPVQPALEMVMQEGRVDFGEMSPASPPRTIPDAAFIAVKTQRAGSWNLSVAADGDFRAGEYGPTFPIGSLEVCGRLNGAPAPFQPCSTSPVILVSQGPVSGGAVAMDYRLTVGYDAPAAQGGTEYRSNLVYTTSFGTIAASYVDPNPFDPDVHPAVMIRYHYSYLPYPHVSVQILSSTGKVVYSRSFSRPADGWYVETWDGLDRAGYPVPDGVYSYSITSSLYIVAGGYITVRRATGEPSEQTAREIPNSEPEPGRVIEISASARPPSAAVGDVVTVSATLRNASAFDIAHLRLSCELPMGVRPVAGAAAMEGREACPIAPVAAATSVSWDLGSVRGKDSVRFSFKATVGPDARPGGCMIRARASATLGKLIVMSEEVVVPLDLDTSTSSPQGTVVGWVFMDRDGDGTMTEADEAARGARILAGGVQAATSDADGLFVLEGLSPGDHIVRISGPTGVQGWEPRTPLMSVTVAPGEVVRLDVPLRRMGEMTGDAVHGAGPPAAALRQLSGIESVTLEMGTRHASCHVNGAVLAQTRSGFELSLSGEGGITWVNDRGTEPDKALSPGAEGTASGYAAISAPIALNTMLKAGVAVTYAASPRFSGLHLGLSASPARGVTLEASYDAVRKSSRLSGAWEAQLADGLTLSTGLSVAPGVSNEPFTSLVSATYNGPSGIVGRLSLRGTPHPSVEFTAAIPFSTGLSLTLSHRRSILTSCVPLTTDLLTRTILGLRYSTDGRTSHGKTSLSVGGEYDIDSRELAASLSSSGGVPGGGSWQAGLMASVKPQVSSFSLQAAAALPGRHEPVGVLSIGGESRRLDDGGTTRKLSLSLSCSTELDAVTTLSGTILLKRVDDHSPPAPVSTVTRSASAYFDRRVADGLSVGAGGWWTHTTEGGVSVAGAEARATCHLTPCARLVLGYRVPLHGSLSAADGARCQSEHPGPYLRLVLLSAHGLVTPSLEGRE